MRFALLIVLAQAMLLFACGTSVEQPEATPSALESPTEVEPVAESDPYLKYTYAERRGKRLFDAYCTVCHGATGQGDGFNSYNLDPRPHDLSHPEYMNAISDQSLKEVIAQGGRGVNKSILMPGYAHTLTQRDIDDLVAYIRTFTREDR
jgi:mono/diheme cytochrome c family protein